MRRIKKNNKGFSLIEMVVAVVILAIVVIPLLQAFTTSARLTSRSKSIGEATAAAQNLQEIIEAKGVASMLGQLDTSSTPTGHMVNKSVLELLYGDDYVDGIGTANTIVSQEPVEKGGEVVGYKDYDIINGIRSGSATYNAKVIFNPLDAEANKKQIAQYTDMAGTFSQPYASTQNPDDLADTEFQNTTIGYNEAKSPVNGQQIIEGKSGPRYSGRKRTIDVNVVSKPAETGEGYKVEVSVVFNYTYTVTNIKKTASGRTQASYNYTTSLEYKVFPTGKYISSYDEKVAVFLMYYAFYENTNSDTINVNIDKDNDDSDLQFQLFLVKQWPMVVNAQNEKVLAPANDYIITNKDKHYTFYIYEKHNSRYKDKITYKQDQVNYVEDQFRNVYTNANISFVDDKANDTGTYQLLINARKAGEFKIWYGENAESWDRLVEKALQDRYYDVEIEIYESTVDIEGDENAEPIYTLKANKLK